MARPQIHRQRGSAGCKRLGMAVVLLAGALFATTASAQVELVPSLESPDAPAVFTVTASTPPDEPILAYEWSGLGMAPRCRAQDCTIDLPVASCRRVQVSVTDRFGTVTTVDRQICANESGSRPPRATIGVEIGTPMTAVAQVEEGDARVTITHLWIDDVEVSGTRGELPEDGACHVVDLLVADVEGRIGLDQRIVCRDPDAPRIEVGGDPSFCPPLGETLRACAEVIDPLGRGVTPIEGAALPLDGCGETAASARVERVLVSGAAGSGRIHGSMIACRAPSIGRPNLLFVRAPSALVVTRGAARSTEIQIDGGEPPFSVTARLFGSETIDVSPTVVGESSATLSLRVPDSGDWSRFEVRVTDTRGLEAVGTATVTTMFADPTGPQSATAIGCSAFPGEGAALLWILIGAIPLLRRRR